MQHLTLQPNFGIPSERYRHAYQPGDQFYEMLIEGHRDLDDAQSELMNARLVLLLANHIGDLRVLQEAIEAARAGVTSGAASARLDQE
jgi:anthranilate phosphoribosyltransferase